MPAFDSTYEPGKRLTCLCGRAFKTERGLKQHLQRPLKAYEDGLEVSIKHGRCYTATAKLIARYVAEDAMRTMDVYKKLREQCNVEPKPSSFVKYTPSKM